MKILINRDLLFFNLNNISRALSTKPPMPVLTGIKIEARGNAVYLTASNNEISIQTVIKDKSACRLRKTESLWCRGNILSKSLRRLKPRK